MDSEVVEHIGSSYPCHFHAIKKAGNEARELYCNGAGTNNIMVSSLSSAIQCYVYRK